MIVMSKNNFEKIFDNLDEQEKEEYKNKDIVYYNIESMHFFINENDDDQIIYAFKNMELDNENKFNLINHTARGKRIHILRYLISVCNLDYCLGRLNEMIEGNTNEELQERYSLINYELLNFKLKGNNEYIKNKKSKL